MKRLWILGMSIGSVLILFNLGCSTTNNPDLSLSNMSGYQITTSRTINGVSPREQDLRPFKIRDTYSTWWYGLSNGRVFALEPALRTEMGPSTKASELEIVSYSNFWQATLKICTLWCYEPRTIVVRGNIWNP